MAPEILILSPLAAAAGAAVTRLSAPVACSWPAKGHEMMLRLVSVRDGRPVGRARAWLGCLVVAGLLSAGGVAAYAAQPSAPQLLPKAVVGVVGSGDQLSLNLKEEGAPPRTLNVGDEYKDGWKLQAVTATKATLAKDGAVEEVGLNPTGVLASTAPAGPPAQVRTAGMLDQASLEKYALAYRTRFKPTSDPTTLAKMTPDEILRMEAYAGVRLQVSDRLNAEFAAGTRQRPTLPEIQAEIAKIMSADDQSDAAVLSRKNLAFIQAATQAELIANPPIGPDTYYYVPPPGGQTMTLPTGETVTVGTNLSGLPSAGRAAGLDPRGWWTGGRPDANGGITYTRNFAPPAPSDPAAAAVAAAQAAAAKAAADRQRGQ